MKKLILLLVVVSLAGCAYVSRDLAISRWWRTNLEDPMSVRVVRWGSKEISDIDGATYSRVVTFRATSRLFPGGFFVGDRGHRIAWMSI